MNQSTTRPFGLANGGSTCYMNALLQALASCPSFSDSVHAGAAAGPPPTRTAAELRGFIAGVGAGAPAADTASRLLAAVDADRRRLGYATGLGPGQQSASEALTYILELADAAEPAGRPPWGGAAAGRAPVAPGPIVAAFAHRYDRRLACRCAAGGARAAPDDVALVCPAFGPAFAGAVTPEQFADALLCGGEPAETLSGYQCEFCRASDTTVVRRRLQRAPSIFTLAFNQYSAHYAPAFPPRFELPRLGGGPPLAYRADAQVVHAGGLAGGHYWAIARRGDNIWRLDDWSASPAPEYELPDGGMAPAIGAYLVFYSLE